MKYSFTSFIGLIFLIISLSSCTDHVIPDPSAVLTTKEWQIDEIRFVQNNTTYYYKRGGSTNVVNFDDAYIKFNQDGTGITQFQGNRYNLTWKFVNPEKTKLTFIMQNGNTPLVTWENIEYSDATLKYTESYTTYAGINSLGQAVRTPR